MNHNFDEAFLKALDILEKDDRHIFLTGHAGTGKTTLINHFRKTTQKNVAVVAPTGVAAVNIAGETIHSFFGFPPNITPDKARTYAKRSKKKKIYDALDILVIDEVSMVRADLLDSVDSFLRSIRGIRIPFGGVRLIMVGDLHQLPPVVTSFEREALFSVYESPYFFSAQSFQKLFQSLFGQLGFLELTTIYRQTDTGFISLLDRLRYKKTTDEDLEKLNKQVVFDEDLSGHVLLTSVNQIADEINAKKLNEIMGQTHAFHATLTGKFSDKQAPAGEVIHLKSGAKVMLLNNDPDGRWINGTIGIVYEIKPQSVIVKLETGDKVEVFPFTWNTYKTEVNEKNNKLESFEIGSFKQIPLRLAWAITIHKSQGKTFQKVAVDLGRGAFAHGQTYVALSRATSLSGLRLVRPLTHESIIVDPKVIEFLEKLSLVAIKL